MAPYIDIIQRAKAAKSFAETKSKKWCSMANFKSNKKMEIVISSYHMLALIAFLFGVIGSVLSSTWDLHWKYTWVWWGFLERGSLCNTQIVLFFSFFQKSFQFCYGGLCLINLVFWSKDWPFWPLFGLAHPCQKILANTSTYT